MNEIYNWDTPLQLSKYYVPGLGYSPAGGPPVGGYGPANPSIYSSTFFGSDVKGLLPLVNMFSKKRSKKRLNKRLKKRSNKRSKKVVHKRSRNLRK
jgi:hypothetical protein